MIKYLLLIFGFILLLIKDLSTTHNVDENTKKKSLTAIGWMAVIIACVSFVIGLLNIYSEKQEIKIKNILKIEKERKDSIYQIQDSIRITKIIEDMGSQLSVSQSLLNQSQLMNDQLSRELSEMKGITHKQSKELERAKLFIPDDFLISFDIALNPNNKDGQKFIQSCKSNDVGKWYCPSELYKSLDIPSIKTFVECFEINLKFSAVKNMADTKLLLSSFCTKVDNECESEMFYGDLTRMRYDERYGYPEYTTFHYDPDNNMVILKGSKIKIKTTKYANYTSLADVENSIVSFDLGIGESNLFSKLLKVHLCGPGVHLTVNKFETAENLYSFQTFINDKNPWKEEQLPMLINKDGTKEVLNF